MLKFKNFVFDTNNILCTNDNTLVCNLSSILLFSVIVYNSVYAHWNINNFFCFLIRLWYPLLQLENFKLHFSHFSHFFICFNPYYENLRIEENPQFGLTFTVFANLSDWYIKSSLRTKSWCILSLPRNRINFCRILIEYFSKNKEKFVNN